MRAAGGQLIASPNVTSARSKARVSNQCGSATTDYRPVREAVFKCRLGRCAARHVPRSPGWPFRRCTPRISVRLIPKPRPLLLASGGGLAASMLLPAGSSLPSWFWLAASCDGWQRIEKLPVLAQMVVRAKRHKVLERIITLLAPLGVVVDLQILERPAPLTSPPVPLQHPLHQTPVNLLPQLDPLHLPHRFAAFSNSSSRPWPARCI